MALCKFRLFSASRNSFLNFRQCSSTGKTPSTTTDDKSLIPNNEKTDSNKPAAVENLSNVPTVSTPPK